MIPFIGTEIAPGVFEFINELNVFDSSILAEGIYEFRYFVFDSDFNISNSGYSNKDNVISNTDAIEVNNNIIGKRLSFFGPSLKAKSIRAKSIKVRGNISIQNDVTASETLDIEFNPRRFKINILGFIYSPKVTISFRGSFTKWFILSHTILKKFGKKTRRKRNFTIENLNIEAKELIILTHYPPEKVNVEYINSNINVLNIEIKQLKPPTPPTPPTPPRRSG